MANYTTLNDQCYRIIGEITFGELICNRPVLWFGPIMGTGTFNMENADIWDATLVNCTGVGTIQIRPDVASWTDLGMVHSSWGTVNALCENWNNFKAKDKDCWGNLAQSRATTWGDLMARQDWQDVPRDYIEVEVPVTTQNIAEIEIEVPYTFA